MNNRAILMCPGPSEVYPEVLLAMARPIVSHVNPEFLALLDTLQDQLKHIFQTKHTCMLLPGTGSAGMEAALINFLNPLDKVLVGIIGHFGERIRVIAQRIGCNVKVLKVPEGKAIDPQDVKRAIGEFSPKIFAFVHGETSTGALQPLEDISSICAEHGVLTLVDTVASLGGVDVPVDRLGLNIVYSGSQKCLGCPPGASPITFDEKAEVLLNSSEPRNYYLDLRLIKRYWDDKVYHHTPAVNLFYACNKAFDMIVDEGLKNRFERHKRLGLALQRGVESMGLKVVADEAVRSPAVTAVYLPEGVGDVELKNILLRDYGIEIATGIAPFNGKTVRFGTMAESARPGNVLQLLNALECALKKLGVSVGSGLNVAAKLM